VAPRGRIIERPLLDNGSVSTNPAPLSGRQLNTFTRQRIYNGPLHGNANQICAVPAVTKRLATIVSKTEPLSKVSPRPSECRIYQ
jgi:hypothetical protein